MHDDRVYQLLRDFYTDGLTPINPETYVTKNQLDIQTKSKYERESPYKSNTMKLAQDGRTYAFYREASDIFSIPYLAPYSKFV